MGEKLHGLNEIMNNRPEIKPGDWIIVQNVDCVVANVRQPGHTFGDCEVVFNPSKPTNHDVIWNGVEWKFVEYDIYGGYSIKETRFTKYVRILKRGHWAYHA
jgi:hypothetical protein